MKRQLQIGRYASRSDPDLFRDRSRFDPEYVRIGLTGGIDDRGEVFELKGEKS